MFRNKVSESSESDETISMTHKKGSLISRNITVLDRRTSIRLEPEMWIALKDIANREGCTIHELCSLVSLRKSKETSLTAAIRVFLMLYFRAAATQEGHNKAGHGNFSVMKQRARLSDDELMGRELRNASSGRGS